MKCRVSSSWLGIAILSPVTLLAQLSLNFELGYNRQFGQPDGWTNVSNQYNTLRPELIQPLEGLDYMDGITFVIGGSMGHWGYLEAGYTVRSGTEYATWESNGIPYREEFKVSSNGIIIGLGIPIQYEQSFATVLGVRAEATEASIKGRLLSGTDTDAEWMEWDDGSYPFFTFFWKVVVGPVCVEPYYSLATNAFNLEYLNNDLNYDGWPQYTDRIPFRNAGGGIRITFSTLAWLNQDL